MATRGKGSRAAKMLVQKKSMHFSLVRYIGNITQNLTTRNLAGKLRKSTYDHKWTRAKDWELVTFMIDFLLLQGIDTTCRLDSDREGVRETSKKRPLSIYGYEFVTVKFLSVFVLKNAQTTEHKIQQLLSMLYGTNYREN